MKTEVRATAIDDILRRVARHAAQGLPAYAHRFATAVTTAIETASESPASGIAHPVAHPALTDLYTRPVKGFSDIAIYYLAQPDRTIILRVLHGKQDIESN